MWGGGVAVVVLALFILARQRPAQLAHVVPDDVAVFVELPSVGHALESAGAMKVFDGAKISPKETATLFTSALRSAFGLTNEDAERFGESVVGVAYMARAASSEDRGAWILSVNSTDPTERLLASSRFTSDGTYRGGLSYRLAQATPGSTASPLERALCAFAIHGSPERVVWFAGPRLLLLGEQALISEVAEVVDGRRKPLDTSAVFQESRKEARPDAAAYFFADENALQQSSFHASSGSFFDAYLNHGGVAAGDLHFAPAGVVVSAEVALSGTALPAVGDLPHATPLTIPDRLPAETAFYAAASTKHTSQPADVRSMLLGLVPASASDTGRIRESVEAIEHEVGISLSDLADVAGDEAAIALLADKAFKYGGSIPLLQAGLEWAGAVFVVKVESDAAAQRVVAKLREAIHGSELGKFATVSASSDGFEVAMSSKASALIGGVPPGLRVRYAKKELAIVLARPELMQRTFAALDGTGSTLKDDASHALAMSSLRRGARAYAWLDMGRVASVAFAAGPSARVHAKARGMPVDSATLSGPTRLAMAAALDFEAKGAAWNARVDVLNPWAAGLLVAWQAVPEPARSQSATAVPPPSRSSDAAPPPRPFFPEALDEMAVCADYLKVLDACAERARTPEAHDGFVKRRAEAFDTFVHTPPASRLSTNATCVGPMLKLQKTPDCR
jgi:hypothetical protein